MTLWFNLKILEEEAKCNSEKFIFLLERFFYKGLPRLRDKFISNRSLAGVNYLLNPEPLFKLKKTIDINFIVQYVKLSARRDYTLYKYYKDATLHISYYPDLNLNALKRNPLLEITDSQIKFLYEEKAKNGSIIQ